MRNFIVGMSLVGLIGTAITVGNIHIHESQRLSKIVEHQEEIIEQSKLTESILRKEIDRLKGITTTQRSDLNKKNQQLELLHKQYEKLKKQKQTSPTAQMPSRGEVSNKRKLIVEATAYTSECKGCTGQTASGYWVKNTIHYQGMRVVAMDTNLVPLHSIVKIEFDNQSFYAAVIDRGGAIKGKRLDLLVNSYEEALDFGRKQVNITVIREGRG